MTLPFESRCITRLALEYFVTKCSIGAQRRRKSAPVTTLLAAGSDRRSSCSPYPTGAKSSRRRGSFLRIVGSALSGGVGCSQLRFRHSV